MQHVQGTVHVLLTVFLVIGENLWIEICERNVALSKVTQSTSPPPGCFQVVTFGSGVSFNASLCFPILAGYPSLRIEKNDLRSVTLMEAKAKVKDIAISRERVTLRDVLHEGTCLLLPLVSLVSSLLFLSPKEAPKFFSQVWTLSPPEKWNTDSECLHSTDHRLCHMEWLTFLPLTLLCSLVERFFMELLS